VVMVNKDVRSALKLHFLEEITEEEKQEYLFRSRKGGALTRESVATMLKKWTAGMKRNHSTHSLRKTWGYHRRTQHGIGIEHSMELVLNTAWNWH
jgi:site-specific recombinase XerD